MVGRRSVASACALNAARTCEHPRVIYVSLDGASQGPFTAEELSELWRAGEFDERAQYWHRGMTAWAAVSAFEAPPVHPQTPPALVILTTAPTIANRAIEVELDVIGADAIASIRDWLSELDDLIARDAVLTRARQGFRDARTVCLERLRYEAHAKGADAVVAVSITFSEMGRSGASVLFWVATGTAVRLGPPPPPPSAGG